jgi:hypothetical protein
MSGIARIKHAGASSIFDNMKKLIAVIIIIFAIAVIIFSIPGAGILKINFPPVF